MTFERVDHERVVGELEDDLSRIKAQYETLYASHQALVETLVQVLEEIAYPLNNLMRTIENVVAQAEHLVEGRQK